MSAILFGSLVQSKGFVQHLKEQKKLDLITSYSKTVSPPIRRAFFAKLFVSLPAMTELMETGDPKQWLDLLGEKEGEKIDEDPFDGGPAAVSLTKVFYLSPPVIARLAQRKELDKVLAIAAKVGDDRNSNQFLVQLLREPKNVTVFLEQGKFKDLVKLIGQEKQDYVRSESFRVLLSAPETIPTLIRIKQVDDLLEVLAKENLAKNSNLLDSLFDGRRNFIPLVKEGYLAKILELVSHGSPEMISRRLVLILNSPEIAPLFSTEKELDSLIKLAQDQSKPTVREGFIVAIFNTPPIMDRLIHRRRFDTLLAMIHAESDHQIKGRLLIAFVQNNVILQLMKQQKQLNQLVEFAQNEEDNSTRSNYLALLFRNQPVVQSLLQEKQFDVLVAQIERESDQVQRATLAGHFYVNSAVVQELVVRKQLDKLLEIAKSQTDEQQRYSFLIMLLSNNPAYVAEMATNGRFNELFEVASQVHQPHLRGGVLGALFSNPTALAGFLKQDRGQALFQLMKKESPETRGYMFQTMFLRSDVLGPLVEADRFDDLLQLTKEIQDASIRGSNLGRLLASPQVLGKLRGAKRTGILVEIALELTYAQSRQNYLWNILQNESSLREIVEAGKLDTLGKMIDESLDSVGQRQSLWRTLFGSEKMLDALSQAKMLVPLLEQLANLEEPRRSTHIQQLLASSQTVSWLIAHGHFATFSELCQSSTDANIRCLGLASLLQSPPAIRQLAKQGKLTGLLAQLLNEPKEGARRQALQTWIYLPSTLESLVQNDQFQPLWDYAHKDADAALSPKWRFELLLSPYSFQKLSPAEHTCLLLAELVAKTPGPQLGDSLNRVLTQPMAIHMLIQSGHLDDLLKLTKSQVLDMNTPYRAALLLQNPKVFQQLKDKSLVTDILKPIVTSTDPTIRSNFLIRFMNGVVGPKMFRDPLIANAIMDIVKAEPNAQTQVSNVRFLLSSAPIRQALVDSDQVDLLDKLRSMFPEDAAVQDAWTQYLFSPSGVIAHLLRQGKSEQALAIEEKFPRENLDLQRIALFLANTGGLDQRIATLQARVTDAPAQRDLRQLVWLLRAKGDLAGAAALAQRGLDVGLQKALAVELGDWETAIRLQMGVACPQPIAIPGSGDFFDANGVLTPASRIEQLGLLVAYRRLAEKPEGQEKNLAEIQQLAAASPQDITINWAAVEALLLNGKVTEGLDIVARLFPSRHFDFLSDHGQYQQAFELVHWPADSKPTREWLESLPVDLDRQQNALSQRVALGTKIAEVRQRLGQRGEADQIIQLVEKYLADYIPSQGPPLHFAAHQTLGAALLRMGRQEQAWKLAPVASYGTQALPEYVRQFDQTRTFEATQWWQYLVLRDPDESTIVRLGKLNSILYPKPTDSLADFNKLVKEVEEFLEKQAPNSREFIVAAVTLTSIRRGDLALAQQLIPAASAYANVAQEALADALWTSSDWADAAKFYQSVWQDNHDKVAQLYLAGEALVRNQQVEAGNRLKEQALLSALDPNARVGLANELSTHGLKEPAEEIYNQVLRWSPPEHWSWNEAYQKLYIYHPLDEPGLLVKRLEQSLLDKLRNSYYFNNYYDYMNFPARISRMKAQIALDRQDFDRVEQELAAFLKGVPGDTSLAIELVPLLEVAGRYEQATSLFDRQKSVLEANLKLFPESALILNNIAWLKARCGRDLLEAEKQAEKALALEPENPGYLDTLAETKFRLGNREAAVKLSERAVELSPAKATLQQNLKRFRDDPIPPLVEKK